MSRLVIALYLILLAIGIPWYWPTDDARHVAGIPLWVITSLIACLLASCLTAAAFLLDKDPSESEPV